MEISVRDQLYLLFLSAAAGLGAGLLYDVLSALKKDGRRKRNALLNAFFFILVTGAAYLVSMTGVSGHSFLLEGGAIAVSFRLYLELISPKAEKTLKNKEKN